MGHDGTSTWQVPLVTWGIDDACGVLIGTDAPPSLHPVDMLGLPPSNSKFPTAKDGPFLGGAKGFSLARFGCLRLRCARYLFRCDGSVLRIRRAETIEAGLEFSGWFHWLTLGYTYSMRLWWDIHPDVK